MDVALGRVWVSRRCLCLQRRFPSRFSTHDAVFPSDHTRFPHPACRGARERLGLQEVRSTVGYNLRRGQMYGAVGTIYGGFEVYVLRTLARLGQALA